MMPTEISPQTLKTEFIDLKKRNILRSIGVIIGKV